MAKIAMIGAGSVVFTKNLLGDILSFSELAQSHIALHDINPSRLEAGEGMARWTASKLGVSPTITTSLNRREVLDGADYVINMVQVGGHRATMIDFDIPKQYGLRQTIGDTLGIGGVFRSLRTIPVLLDICQDMAELCPNAWLLNYTNPMAMLVWAVTRATKINVVGLCHSVQGTAKKIAYYADVPDYELEYHTGGINHMAWYTTLRWNGQDVYPRLREAMDHRYIFAKDKVRFEIMRHFGYFVTESSEHMSEYVPYFIKSPGEIERLDIPLDEYPRRSAGNVEEFEYTIAKLHRGGEFQLKRSEEYASLIIHSMETNTPRHIYGNVENRGLVTNLLEGACVEVRCDLDKNGLHPVPYGELPPQLAALNRTNINVQELTVRAALEHCRDHVYHAAYMDPHTAATLTLPEIKAMVDDLIDAHGDALPEGIRR